MINSAERITTALTTEVFNTSQPEERIRVRKELLGVLRYPPSGMDNFLIDAAPKMTMITLHGGNGSRWDKSWNLPDSQRIRKELEWNNRFSPDGGRSLARGLVTVPNITPKNYYSEKNIPVIGISLLPFSELTQRGADHILVHNPETEKKQIQNAIEPMGFTKTLYMIQELRPVTSSDGSTQYKALGHGDALMQATDKLENSQKDIIVHFVSDVTRWDTLKDTLLVLKALKEIGIPVASVWPEAMRKGYLVNPILRDEEGYPAGFPHNKLDRVPDNLEMGKIVSTTIYDWKTGITEKTLTVGGMNTGVVFYDRKYLSDFLRTVKIEYNQLGSYGFLNKDGSNEFSSDVHIGRHFGLAHKVFTAPWADGRENGFAAKEVNKIPAHLNAWMGVLIEQGYKVPEEAEERVGNLINL